MLGRSDDGIIVCGFSHRNKQSQHGGLRGMLGGRNRLRIDIHRRPQGGMSHQFLHHFEFGSDASEKRRIGVPEGMPADALLNIESRGNGPDVIAKDRGTPVRAPALVQSTRKYPIVGSGEFASLFPGQESFSEKWMQWNRLLGGFSFASAHDAENNRTDYAEFPMLQVNITPLEREQFLASTRSPLPGVQGSVRAGVGDPPTP